MDVRSVTISYCHDLLEELKDILVLSCDNGLNYITSLHS